MGDVRVIEPAAPGLWSRMRSWLTGAPVSAEVQRFDLSWYAQQRMVFDGRQYPLAGFTMGNTKVETPDSSFVGYVQGAYKANGVVFAVSMARQMLFSEARFKFRPLGDTGSGDLFGTPDLAVLEQPWPNGSTGELLARMEQDVTAAGNAFLTREGNRLRRLRPDWVEIILSAPPDQAIECDVVGYKYTAGGPGSGGPVRLYLVDEVAHWSPIPDPLALYRGMSWLTPVLSEIQADAAATKHKGKFFENAATPNLSVSLKETVSEDQFREFMAAMNASHSGVDNAYKTLFLGGGADVKVVGADLRQLDFKATQGAGETRIAAAGRVPPIIVGLSEGLAAATYSNYGQARRAFGDGWARPQWRSACAALSVLVNVPDGAELWYDPRDVAFLREDMADAAQIQATQAQTIRTLSDAGFEPQSCIDAVLSEDLSLLMHSGMFSVQLQTPGAGEALPGGEEPVDGEVVDAGAVA